MKRLLPLIFIAFALCPAGLTAQGTHRVGINSDGEAANHHSNHGGISADGRYVVFSSGATNLAPGDTSSGHEDVFVHDRWTGTTEIISKNPQKGPFGTIIFGNGRSFQPSISADGRYVAFASGATNLLVGTTTSSGQIFRYDRDTNTMELVSRNSQGDEADSNCIEPSLSADGSVVAFTSKANNLSTLDNNNHIEDVYHRDLQTGVTTLVSLAPWWNGTSGHNTGPSISADGRYVAFDGIWLFASDSNPNVYRWDAQTAALERVSNSLSGAQGNDLSADPSIAADGQSVAFRSKASDLVTNDSNGSTDVFVWNATTGSIIRGSLSETSTQLASGAINGTLNGDGTLLAFSTTSDDVLTGNGAPVGGSFLRNLNSGEITHVSRDSSHQVVDAFGGGPIPSSDGQYVVYQSMDSRLAANGIPGVSDAYLYGGPHLQASGTCPGVMDFTITGASPSAGVAIVWGWPTGAFVIPSGFPCNAVQLDLMPTWLPAPGYMIETSNANGEVMINATVPASACGLGVQALDMMNCTKSNLIIL